MNKGFSSVTKAPTQRQRRAGELIRHVLAEVFQRGEVHDPDMPKEPITVTEVKASPDLRHATVYCTVLGRDDSDEAIVALNKVSGKIRVALGARIEMKYTPALHFSLDESFGEAARLAALISAARRRDSD